MSFTLTVPGTDDRLVECGERLLGPDGSTFGRACEGIWDLLLDDRRAVLDRFASDYAAVRRAEDRELGPAEIRRLPEIDADHPLAAMWTERAESYARLRRAIDGAAPGSVLDIGAGSGWLAADLARRGWDTAAVDVTVAGGDGLACARHHDADILLVRADMNDLPFASSSVDLAVFNAALHYAASPADVLREAARAVRPGGAVAVLDSPVFDDVSSGELMVREFAAHVRRRHGIEPAAHEGRGFLVPGDFAGLDFASAEPRPGVRDRLHRWRGARRAGREIARRPLLVARVGPEGSA